MKSSIATAPAAAASDRPARAVIVSLTLLLGLGATGAAQAQWMWRDANGHAVYSDVPPPSDVPPSSIVRRPAAGDAMPAGDASRDAGQPDATREGQKPAAAPQKSLADQELEFRKRRQEREKNEAKQAEADARDAQRAQECERARDYLRTLNDGVPLVHTDAEGNRQFVDEQQRAAEVKLAQDMVARNCQ